MWFVAFWNSAATLSIAITALTGVTIFCSIGIFVVKVRQDALNSRKASIQAEEIADQADKLRFQQDRVEQLTSKAAELQARAKDLALKAVNAERNVSDVYDFRGARRLQQPGKILVMVGPEMSVFNYLIELKSSESWTDMLSLSSTQIAITPDWLTPYLFAGIAYANIAKFKEAREMLTAVVTRAGNDPNYSYAQELLHQLDHQSRDK